MITFHPDENLLAEYAAGSLDWGLSISVKAHLAMCPQCRRQLSKLNMVGAALLNESAPASSDMSANTPSDFDSLMQKIRSLPKQESKGVTEGAKLEDNSELPEIVRKLLPKERIKWRRVSPSLREAQLTTGQDKYEVCLHKISRGAKVAEHDHGGREVTVILQGSFSDEDGTYNVGDFMMREPGQKHRPTAAQNQDCLCLSVVEAPVRLTGVLGKLINPFLSFQPG